MSAEILDASIDWIARSSDGVVNVILLGGEPTLEPRLIDRAVKRSRRWLRAGGIRLNFTMTTNGLAIDEPLAAMLAKAGVHYTLSIDGVGERHDSARPARDGKPVYERLVRALPMLLRYQPKIPVRTTVTPKSVDTLAEDLGALASLGFDSFIVAPASGIAWPDEALKAFVDGIVAFSRSRPLVGGRPTPHLSPFDDRTEAVSAWGCGAGRGRYCIDPLGKIFACGRFAQLDSHRGLVLGDVHKGIDPAGSIAAFRDSPKASRDSCAACEIRDRCIGGCPAINLSETGSLVTPSPNECRHNKLVEDVQRHITLTQPRLQFTC